MVKPHTLLSCSLTFALMNQNVNANAKMYSTLTQMLIHTNIFKSVYFTICN